MTKSISRRNVGAILLASVAMGVLSGCAAVGKVSPEGDKEALKKRAQEYWALVKANDRVKAWNYEELSKDPNGSLEGYLKRGGITFDAVEVREVKSLEGDRATVEAMSQLNRAAMQGLSILLMFSKDPDTIKPGLDLLRDHKLMLTERLAPDVEEE